MPPISPIDEPNEEEREEKLTEDYDTPFSLPDQEGLISESGDIDDSERANRTTEDDTGKLDDTHPSTDTNIQAEEVYDEGVAGAAEAGEPNARDDVLGYNPDEDTRRKRNQEKTE